MHTARRLRQLIVCGLMVALAVGLAACGSNSESDSDEVAISVMGLPPTTKAATREAFLNQVAAFEDANPNIHIDPSDSPWDVQTFAAKIAGGKAETVLEIPLTEPPGLIDRGQVADITEQAKALPEFDAFDKRVMEPLTRDGKIYGLPESLYVLGLDYNRKLFTEAGLDPDKPPTTWEEFRADAKQIHDRTGMLGYAPITTNNSGGWHLTAMTYSNGGLIEKTEDGKQVAAFTDTDASLKALELMHQMRFTDNSVGTNVLRKNEDIAPEFAAGKIGMYINAPSAYKNYVSQFKGNPDDFGAAALPQGPGNATLMGGTVLMVSAKATEEQKAAAVKWIEFQYIQPQYNPEAAAAQAKANAADNLPVGVPGLPIFDKETVDKVNTAIEPYVNVTLSHFQPYVDGIADMTFVPEPSVAAQDVYAALDPVMQGVLTREDADAKKLLDTAKGRVDSILAQQQG